MLGDRTGDMGVTPWCLDLESSPPRRPRFCPVSSVLEPQLAVLTWLLTGNNSWQVWQVGRALSAVATEAEEQV